MPARILLADDDHQFRESLSGKLARHGFEVVAVANGTEALRRFDTGTFDLVLADVLMPEVDGLAVASAIRRIASEQEIILLTQKADVGAAVAALRAGASDYLLKPVEDAELFQRVSRALERSALRRERAQLLNENLEFVKNQALYQRCMGMLSTLDLERLQESCLADLCSVCDAQSGALWLMDERDELTLRSYRGLLDRSALSPRIALRPGVLSERLAGPNAFEVPGKPLTQAFYLPLRVAGELVGLALCCDRLTGEFREADLSVVRAVGDFAATALRNARRFATLERHGLKDKETAAYNLAYLVDYAAKEAYKARRYGRVFSMLVVSLDGLDTLQAQRGVDRAAQLVRGSIAALNNVARDSDVVAKGSETELFVLLPETDYLGALLFARRARAAIARETFGDGTDGLVALTIGAATFPRDGNDFDELLRVSRRRTAEARTSLARKLDLGPLDFWQSVELLLGSKESPKLPVDDRAGPTRRGYLPPGLFSQLQIEMALEVARNPKARGVLYLGCGEIRSDLPAVKAFDQLPAECAIRVYLLGRRADVESNPWATPVFLDGEERIATHEFLLLFTENASYALIQHKAARGAPWGFHTSDAAVVDELVTKLQERYDLQPL
ncbi:MAG TPA: response regulator [Myxococcales bacterium]|jgi:diguanylate cyclase (GGDEF)-like protein